MGEPVRFVLATHNPGKLREMGEILSRLGVEVLSPAETGVTAEAEETGTTFRENALLKARQVCAAAGLPAIADDSGLCVEALNGGPGVYSARYGGEGLDDAGRRALLLESIRGQTDRRAHFSCCVACAFPNGDTLEAEGRCDGLIAFAPLGTGGFGYDPVFQFPPLGRTFAQLSQEEKAAVSHRGKALAAFAEKLDAYLKTHREPLSPVAEAPEPQSGLTGKQRSRLRAMANGIPTILQVGKEGIGENLIRQAEDALEARELIKGRVLENCMEYNARQAAQALARATRSEPVQVIGTRFVLYRESHTIPKEKRIRLEPPRKAQKKGAGR